PAPPAPGVAGERERRAAEPGHEGDSRCAASGRAGAHEAARGGAGRLRTALRRAGGPDGTGRLPGRALRHACGLVRSSGDALPLPGPGADRGRRRALRGDPSALSPVRQDELPAGPARRAAGRGRRDEEAALLHAGAAPGAGSRGRGLPDRADPCPAPHLEGRRRASLRPARGSGRGALHAPAQARPLHAALRRRVRGPARRPGGGGLMSVAATLDLEGMLRRLHLPTVRRLYAELARRAEEEGMSYRDYLATLAAEEIAHRAQTRITRSVRKARFPFLRTIEEFDFTFQTSVRLQMLGSLLGPGLVSEGRCAIFSGPPGRGKTHLAVAGAYRAARNGFEPRFPTTDELIGGRSAAVAQGRLAAALEPYVHPHVLVIDELGYQSYAPDAANVLYRVVGERYLKKRPMLVTTNKPLAALGQLLHDGDLAEAILDRLLERGTHFVLRGRSYRTRHHKDEEVRDTGAGAA